MLSKYPMSIPTVSFQELLSALPKQGPTLEIGCFDGDSTSLFLHELDSRLHVAVDPYREYLGEYGYENNPAGYGDQQVQTDRYMRTELRFLFDNRVKLVRATSDEALPKLPRSLFSVIFIDGAHHYCQVKKDILNCIPLAASTSYIICDDYLVGPPKPGFGVNKAVDELIEKGVLLPLCISDDARFKKMVLCSNKYSLDWIIARNKKLFQ